VTRLLCAVAVVGLLVPGAVAQESMAEFCVWAGLGQSAFEHRSAAGYLPVGLQGLYQVAPGLFVGAEASISAVKFSWGLETVPGGPKAGEESVSQSVFGIVAKYEFGQTRIRPLLRAGLGIYAGDFTQEPESGYESSIPEIDESLKTAFGLNFGGGVIGRLGRRAFWVGEFVYHIVTRERDMEGAESFGANNWAVQAGVGMKL
jgi:hypothetical protein